MIVTSEADLERARAADSETEHLEFKEAKSQYARDKMLNYVSALANEGGGALVLGVADRRPRGVVGTAAFANVDELKSVVFNALRWKVNPVELTIEGKRVLAINVKGRPLGRPLASDGRYYMRVGSELRVMSADELRQAFEGEPRDFSAEICEGASLAELDPAAIMQFRKRWARRAVDLPISLWPDAEMLENAELLIDGALTNAAMILLGTRRALGRFLPQAEVIFEYRSRDGDIDFSDRAEYREGFLLWGDDLWDKINTRNEVQQFQSGLFRHEVPAFEEETLREGILNAVCHRDYCDIGSSWLRMWPKRVVIESPGSFPRGVTPENILDRQHPRNRRLAESLGRLGLVERSGQGADRMFRQSVRDAKALPDFEGSDEHHVILRLSGIVSDPEFLSFLERVGQEKLQTFTTADFLALDAIRRGTVPSTSARERLPYLRDLGVVERIGRGKFILSREFQASLGKTARYTREKGLDRGAERELLFQHLARAGSTGAAMAELMEVLPDRSREHVRALMNELRLSERVYVEGTTRAARWHAASRRIGNESDRSH